MAQAAATFTATIAADWDPGTLIETDDLLVQVLQNAEHISQIHDHDPDTANMGGPLVIASVEEILVRMF